jgi:hypothetical protein
MTLGNKFCTNCGAALAPSDRFCGGCGKAVNANTAPSVPAAPPVMQAPPPPVFTPPPVAPPEQPIGMIPAVSRKKGLMTMEGFAVMVTQKRMIFAAMTNELINAEAKKAAKEGGFFGGMLNSATAGLNFYKRYLNMSPDTALAENPQNFAIELTAVRKVNIEAGKEINNYANIKANQDSIIQSHAYADGKLDIITAAEKFSFNLPGTSYAMAVETLRKAGLR